MESQLLTQEEGELLNNFDAYLVQEEKNKSFWEGIRARFSAIKPRESLSETEELIIEEFDSSKPCWCCKKVNCTCDDEYMHFLDREPETLYSPEY